MYIQWGKIRNKASYILEILPGLLLSFAVMLAGIYAADSIGFLMQQAGILTAGSKTPVSGIFVAILLWDG